MKNEAMKIFVNLPVKDLEQTKAFFTALGFSFNPQFTDNKAACLVINDYIYAMLLKEEYFKSFTKKEIPDTSTNAEAILAFSVSSREEVESIVNKAFEAGAKPYNDPQDHGFMYIWGFQDLDGHLWEFLYMEQGAVEGA